METRASYALIGASLLAGVIAFAGFVLWLGHLQFNRDFAEYNVVFDGAVNGLSEGGQVRYLGIVVGEVTDLSIDKRQPNRVVARIRIDAETPVRTDSKATLDFAGLTGVTFIQIQPGSDTAPVMPTRTGSDLPVIQSERTSLEEIFYGGQDLIATAQITLAELNEILSGDNVENVEAILENVKVISAAFAEDEQLLKEATRAMTKLADAGGSIDEAAKSLNQLSVEATGLIADLSDGSKLLFADASSAIRRAEQAIDQSETALLETQAAIRKPAVEAIEEIKLLSVDVRLLVRRLDRFARELEQNPQSFIQGSPTPYKD